MTHTNVPPPNHDVELPTKQIMCSPGICDVNVNRPSVAYVCTNIVKLILFCNFTVSTQHKHKQYATVQTLSYKNKNRQF